MNIDRRLRTLETRLTVEPIRLTFEDGSTVLIPSRVNGRDHFPGLLAAAIHGEHSPEMDLLMCAVSITEPGGSHLAELAQAIALSPANEVL